MLKYLRQHGEQGQTAILLALAMIGLLGIVGLALDGGMLYWNQRRAQNGADAAAIAGVTKLAEHVIDETCASGSEQDILAVVQEYAGVNEIPNADLGENVEAFYLVENSDGDRVPLIYPTSGKPWHVGETGSIPCDQDPVGLQVTARFPQQTFLAGVIGIAETNVTVDASAIYETNTACSSFVLLSLDDSSDMNVLHLSGSGVNILGGGVHSNGGAHISGGGQEMYVDENSPIEYGDGAHTNIDSDLEYPTRTIGPAPAVSGDGFYRYADFAEGGYIYQEVYDNDPSMIHIIDGDLEQDMVIKTDNSVKPPVDRFIDGLYIVTGDVHLNKVRMRNQDEPPWRVTIAAKGCIQFSGGGNTLPYARGVLLYSDCDNTAKGAIKMSGSENKWAGLILAPHGDVDISGADNSDLSGMIVAQRIGIRGASNTLQHHPNYCPPEPPKVLLIQ